MSEDQERIRTLTLALRFATAYVAKAVADDLMTGCVVPPALALPKLTAVLGGDDGDFQAVIEAALAERLAAMGGETSGNYQTITRRHSRNP